MVQSCGRLIMILSTERSGSTLLAAILGGNKRVVAPPEMHVLRYADFSAWRQAKPEAVSSLSWVMNVLGEPSTPQELDNRFGGLTTEDVYRELLKLCGSDILLVDKTPAYARKDYVLERIEKLEPFYIWLVRHPLAVLASSQDRRIQRYTEERNNTTKLALKVKLDLRRALDRLWRFRYGHYRREKLRYWCNINVRIDAFLTALPAERFIRIHYEKLVRAPEEQLDRLCAALGLDLEPSMLNPGSNVPEPLAWGLGSEKVRAHSSINPQIADRWKNRFDESLLDKQTLKIMERLGVE